MKEYNAFTTRMENHFMRHANWFSTDEAKVLDGAGCLNDDLLLKWTQHVKNLGNARQTWDDFTDYLLRQINDPKNLTRRTHQRFTDARQKPHQTVRDLAAYMAQLEALLPETYSETQRKENLRTRVLPEIRSESLRYTDESKTYDGFVAHLAMIEEEMPARKGALRKGSKESIKKGTSADKDKNHPKDKTKSDQDTQSSSARSTSTKRSDYFAGECSYCHKWGHKAEDCRKRKADEKAKKGKTNNETEESKN